MGEETKTLENRKKNKHRAENFVTQFCIHQPTTINMTHVPFFLINPNIKKITIED